MSARASPRSPSSDSLTISTPGEHDVVASRLFRAAPERVFRLFTDRATAPLVWSPHPEQVTIEEYDFRRGGRYAIVVHERDGTSTRFHGEFREVVPPRRVVNTFAVSTLPGMEALETDEYAAEGPYTRLTVRWTYPSRADRDKMAPPEMEEALATMWNRVAARLEAPGNGG